VAWAYFTEDGTVWLFGYGCYLITSNFCSLVEHRHAKRAGVIFCDRSIRRTVYSDDLFKFFLVAMYSKKETGNLLYIGCYIGNGKIAT